MDDKKRYVVTTYKKDSNKPKKVFIEEGSQSSLKTKYPKAKIRLQENQKGDSKI